MCVGGFGKEQSATKSVPSGRAGLMTALNPMSGANAPNFADFGYWLESGEIYIWWPESRLWPAQTAICEPAEASTPKKPVSSY